MGWPQYTLMVLIILGNGMHLANHGKPVVRRDGSPARWNWPLHTFRVIVWTWLLWAGGFFSG